uniref:Uncharacterized protein n=1 Tax=Magallana gigas TaxID=29159 RepID=A0A8W8KKM8_MAGGI
MDLKRFFLVSFHLLVGVTIVVLRTLPVSNDIVPKLFCETEATGCCKNVNNTTIKVRECSLLRVYFHRNSTGCDKAFCFERPDVDHAPMRNSSVGKLE